MEKSPVSRQIDARQSRWRLPIFTIISFVFLVGVQGPVRADESTGSSETLQQRDTRMAWWREARFGMFVHWGLYSIPAGEWDGQKWTSGGMEWIQWWAGIPAEEYARRLVPQFKPKKGFAREWAQQAKAAGCKYVVFTSKHHEGFALHDSAVSDYDAKDACGRDIFKEIVEALRAEGLKVGIYHSVIDWHHPDAYAGMGLPTIKGVTNEGRNNANYVNYLHHQVKELVSGYGPLDIVWWDYSSKQCQGESWRADELMAMVRKHQPGIIMNNRLFRSSEAGWPKDWSKGFVIDPKYGDFSTPEQHIPPTGVPGVDWETCMTMNGTWGYSRHDQTWKSTQQLIRNLVDIASKGGNYLLNIGPMADGTVPEESVVRMQEIGQWMRVNGESIYGTQASPFAELIWGRCTQKQMGANRTRLYLQVFDWPADGKLMLSGLLNTPVKAFLLADSAQRRLNINQSGNQVTIQVPRETPDQNATVVVLDIAGKPRATSNGSSLSRERHR